MKAFALALCLLSSSFAGAGCLPIVRANIQDTTAGKLRVPAKTLSVRVLGSDFESRRVENGLDVNTHSAYLDVFQVSDQKTAVRMVEVEFEETATWRGKTLGCAVTKVREVPARNWSSVYLYVL